MKIKELKNIIEQEIEKGNITDDSEVLFLSYMESEWGLIVFNPRCAKAKCNILFLGDNADKFEEYVESFVKG
mgnify:FL=1